MDTWNRQVSVRGNGGGSTRRKKVKGLAKSHIYITDRHTQLCGDRGKGVGIKCRQAKVGNWGQKEALLGMIVT